MNDAPIMLQENTLKIVAADKPTNRVTVSLSHSDSDRQAVFNTNTIHINEET